MTRRRRTPTEEVAYWRRAERILITVWCMVVALYAGIGIGWVLRGWLG